MMRLLVLFIALALATHALADRKVNNSATFSKTIELKHAPESSHCQATASQDYFQRGAEAQVETTIDTDECDAAEGSYVIKITVRADGAEEPEVLEFPETWERSDDAPVEAIRRYPIGDDVDLLRVRTRKLSCTCKGMSADAEE